MARFQKKVAAGEPEADGTPEVEAETAETENPAPAEDTAPPVAEEPAPAPAEPAPETSVSAAPAEPEEDEDFEESEEQPRPKITALIRNAVDSHVKGGGDPHLTGEFEALILNLHETRNRIRSVYDKTEGELASWLSHFHDLI